MTSLFSFFLFACIWDTDTIDDELRGLPSMEVIITDRWYRHSREVYRARIEALSPKLAAGELSLEELDDLAVAYERVGERESGLKVLESKLRSLEKRPNSEQRYRYHANRGTILAHSGRFEEALAELDKALKINPEAHFGRERFQVDLIRYIKAARENPKLWSEHNFLSYAKPDSLWAAPLTKFSFIPQKGDGQGELQVYSDAELSEAKEGTIGMLRFGGIEGPELYRSLGDVCASEWDLNLAWWLYKHALHKGHPAQKEIKEAIESIENHWNGAEYGRAPTQEDFEKVLANGQQWQDTFHKLEAEALKRSENPAGEDVLERLLAQADQSVPATGLTKKTARLEQLLSLNIVAEILFVGILLLLGAFILRRSQGNRE